MDALPDILGACMLRHYVPRRENPLKLYSLLATGKKPRLVPCYTHEGYESHCRLQCVLWVDEDLFIDCRFVDGKNKRVSLFDAVIEACRIVASPPGKEIECFHVPLLFTEKMQPTWLSVE